MMAKRKRLTLDAISPEHSGPQPRTPDPKKGGMPQAGPALSGPPIARVAGESAGGGERALAMAEEAGRLIHAIPTGAINPGHLSRDRMRSSEEGMEALRASILTHGQRMPIEVMETGDADFPFGLISGFRRMRAVLDLAEAHPGDARFATLKAFIRRPDDLRGAYVAMVEENEIREDLSHYERARVAMLATQAGAFDSMEQAVDVLYAAGSKARRSKIRSFVSVVEALGAVLVWPQAINERLGLRLADAIRDGRGARLAKAVELGHFHDAAGQNAVLEAVLKDRIAKPAGRVGQAVAPPVGQRDVGVPRPSRILSGGGEISLHDIKNGVSVQINGVVLTKAERTALVSAISAFLSDELSGLND